MIYTKVNEYAVKEVFSMTYFSENLKFLRDERNLSQQEIANIIGIKQRTYSNYERGNTEPSLDVLLKISKLFRTSLDMLVGIALDVSLNKEDRELTKEISKRTNMGNAELAENILMQGFEIMGSKVLGYEPLTLNENLIETAKEIINEKQERR